MLDDFGKLKQQTQELGNHHRKYLHLITTHKDLLIERLEESGIIDEVHLWSASPDLPGEMELICELGTNEKEKLDFLGCFLAFQFLHLNVHAIDVLRLSLSSHWNRSKVYREFMLQMGKDLRRLTTAYMNKLLDLFLPSDQRPNYVICGVGTRADQDDLDLGIVDDSSEKRGAFNKAIGKIQREMLRRAIPLHFHLSEHVGEQGFSASIDEFNKMLDSEIQDFIIITEMLGAQLIMGDPDLFVEFKTEITDRYFYNLLGENRFHEGYLRGMMGEIRTLQLRKLSSNSIHPKQDALRIIKGLLSAQKTVYGIRKVNAWEIIDELKSKSPGLQPEYESLEEALSFIEVFRFLYQLVEVQEEKIMLKEEGSRKQLELVAELMGYQGIGVVHGYDHLLIHYHEHVQAVHSTASVLLQSLHKHLEDISVFSGFLRNQRKFEVPWQRRDNIATEFVDALRFFRGTKFWDDVMAPIEQDDELLTVFVEDFMAIPDNERHVWVQRYAKWGEVTIIAVLRLLVLLYQKRRQVNSQVLFKELSTAFIERIAERADLIPRLVAVFEHYPKLLNDFLVGLPPDGKEKFAKLCEGEVWSDEVEAVRGNLQYFCRLHHSSSHYFQRFFLRVVDRYPEYVPYLNRPDKLRVLAKGIFARIDSLPTFAQKKEDLGTYYDLEFLRVGLECMEGVPSEKINEDFTEFVDNYLQSLFDVCKLEVAAESEKRIRTRDLLALYAAGGHGRKLAFDDDYDLVILLNSNDAEIRAHSVKIISRLNREIVRRGTMPQYRFAEHFGDYVTTFTELHSFFTDPNIETFIEMSQLLGARKIVGSRKFANNFYDQIVRRHFLDRKEEFLNQIAGEIRSRHEAVDAGIISKLEVKETKGGLRDIELILLLLMAKAEMYQPVTLELQQPLTEKYPHRSDDLDRIFEAFVYLKSRRDLYRLTVAAEDDMIPEETGLVAQILGYCNDAACEVGRQRLIDELQTMTAEVRDIVYSLLDELKL